MTPNIFPVMRYHDAPGAMAWLSRAFGFEKQAEFANADGTIAHAEIRLGAGVIGISSDGPSTPDNPWSSVRQGVYVRVADVDAHHDRAKRAGAAIVRPLANTDYGSREYLRARPRWTTLGLWHLRDGSAARSSRTSFPNCAARAARAPSAGCGMRLDSSPSSRCPGRTERQCMPNCASAMASSCSPRRMRGGSAWGRPDAAISVHVDDPDTLFGRATAAGALGRAAARDHALRRAPFLGSRSRGFPLGVQHLPARSRLIATAEWRSVRPCGVM